MAITSPWVGSSAVAETGERWMTVAGAAVRVGTPFWLSSLIGKSKYDFEILVGKTNRNGSDFTGYGNADGNAFGTKYYDPSVGTLTSFYASTESSNTGILTISGSTRSGYTIKSAEGNTWTFNRISGTSNYSCQAPENFRAYMNSKLDQRIGFFIS